MGILQARILEWIAMPSSRGSSQPRDWLSSYHMLARLCLPLFKLGMWTENFHMYKLVLKRQEPEIKLPTFVGSWRKQGNCRKTSASLISLKFLTVWVTRNWKILTGLGVSGHLTCLPRNLYEGQKPTVRLGYEQWTGSKLGKEYIKTVYCLVALLF